MNKIKTYQDLMEEKVRLEAALVIQRATLHRDIAELKQEWKPAIGLVAMFSRSIIKGNANPLISLGVGLIGDVLLKNVLLGRSRWIVRLVLPFLVRNFTTHVLNEGGTSIIRKLIDKFKTNSNGNEVRATE